MDVFQSIVGRLDYPMFVVTTKTGDELSGCLVGFATQGSIDPARFVVCISDKNRTFRVIERGGAEAVAVHVVPEGGQRVVELFGGETGDDRDKFDRCDWSPGPLGLPLLADCPSWFAGTIIDRLRLGDHVGYVLEPFAGEDGGGGFFPFRRAKEIEPGHEA